MKRPLLIDGYACQGGTSEGYRRAGFDVFGVDLWLEHNRARYPFPGWQGDVLTFLERLIILGRHECGISIDDVAAFAMSPPCQHASAGTRAMRAAGDDRHLALIEPTRALLEASGKPYVIENVAGAALRDPLTLCWSMFHRAGSVTNEDGVPLRMTRHRLFESNVALMAPGPCHHPKGIQVAGSYGAAQRTIEGAKARRGGYVPSIEVQRKLLGIDWMTERAMHQAVPPVYTEHIGAILLDHLEGEVAA